MEENNISTEQTAATEAQATEAAAVTAQVPAPEQAKVAREPSGKKLGKAFSKEHLVKTLVLFLAVIAIIGAGIGILSSFSPKAVARRYIIARVEEDVRRESKLLAYDRKAQILAGYSDEEQLYEKASDRYGEEINSWTDYCKVVRAMEKETLEDHYGEYEITAEATKEKDISVKKLESELGSTYKYLERYGFDPDSVKSAKVVTVKFKLKGEDSTVRETFLVYLAKIGASWKVVDYEYADN